MTDETTALSGGETIVNPLPADAPVAFDTAESAAKYMLSLKEPAESADRATADNESAPEADTGAEKPPGETQEADPEEKLPPIERPRSWSKDADDDWNALPRARQEKIAANEQAREADVNRRINEAAEKTKAVDAKVKEAEQVKQQYEAKLADQMKNLLDYNDREFAAIKSQADIDYLASEAVRLSGIGETAQSQQITSFLNAWQLHQGKMAGVKTELDKAESEKAKRQFSDWNSHVATENNLAKELIPDLADPEKNTAFYKRAVDRMKDLKFSPEEISDLATGKKMLSIHDHRLQQLLFSDFQLSNIQKAKVEAVKTPVPPVQRPGAARPAGGQDSDNIRALEAKLNQTGSEKDAWALYEAKLKSDRRAS